MQRSKLPAWATHYKRFVPIPDVKLDLSLKYKTAVEVKTKHGVMRFVAERRQFSFCHRLKLWYVHKPLVIKYKLLSE